MFVKPAEDRVVRRPDTLVHLRPEGEDVPNTEFWVRRLRDGDVVEAEPVTASEPAVPPASGEEPARDAVEAEPAVTASVSIVPSAPDEEPAQ